jgi:hypothetical protein
LDSLAQIVVVLRLLRGVAEATPKLGTQKQLLDQAVRAFESGNGDGAAEREIERLHAKIGPRIVTPDFLARRSGRRAPR